MSLIGGGGGGGGKILGEYIYKVSETTGELELWKGDEKIAAQSPDGSWFRTAVSTGVGSLHLGGDISSTPSHSLSSIGQNCGFKSEAFSADPDKAIVWFPPWQGISADLTEIKAPTYLSFGAVQPTFTPNGAAQAISVPFDFTTTMIGNICVASITCIATEAYSGVIRNIIKATATGSETHESQETINVAAGDSFTISYPSCYFARQGDELRLQMLKEDGTPLQVRRGTTNLAHPWRLLRVRTFADMPITSSLSGDIKEAYRTSDHDGWVLLNGRAVSSLTATQQAVCAALGIAGNLPDARNKFSVGAGSLYDVNDTGGSSFIARAALPNVTLSFNVTSGAESQGHTHQVDPPQTLSGGQSVNHTHVIPQLTGSAWSSNAVPSGNRVAITSERWDNDISGNLPGSGRQFAYTASGATILSSFLGHSHTVSTDSSTTGVNNTVHSHAVKIPVFASAGVSQSHTHNVSGNTVSMNGNVNQIAHLPPYIAFAKFMYLGF